MWLYLLPFLRSPDSPNAITNSATTFPSNQGNQRGKPQEDGASSCSVECRGRHWASSFPLSGLFWGENLFTAGGAITCYKWEPHSKDILMFKWAEILIQMLIYVAHVVEFSELYGLK